MKIEATSWNRFHTRDLSVEREVMGRVHEFQFEGRNVRVSVPSEEQADRDRKYEALASCVRMRRDEGKEIPTGYRVHKVDVSIDLEHGVVIRKELLERPPNRKELIPEGKQRYFEETCSQLDHIAHRAFDYWIRVVRWKAGFWEIGQPEVRGASSGGGAYLANKNGGQRFWAGTVYFRAPFGRLIAADIWSLVQEALATGAEPPIWLEYLFDAQQKHETGDQSGCVLSLAIACESMLRHIVNEQVPDRQKADPKLWDVINEVNIRGLMRHITGFDFWDKRWKKNCDWPLIHGIFNKRNDIIHLGQNNIASRKDLAEMVSAAEKFIIFADAAIAPHSS